MRLAVQLIGLFPSAKLMRDDMVAEHLPHMDSGLRPGRSKLSPSFPGGIRVVATLRHLI
jgi:hypothetical protein